VAIHETVTSEGIAELVMDNPKVNALNIGDTYRLAELFDSYKRNLDVRVAILTATGKGFCAGVDIREMQNLPGNEGILGANDSCWELFRAIYECAVPVIAAVNDFCLGTGIGIAGNADVIVAADKAVFGLPEIDNGALGAGTHLKRLVPQHRARQMMYTCEAAPASELKSYGSVYKVVSSDELMDTARVVAGSIAAKAPAVVRKAKRAFNTIDADPMKTYRTEQGFTMELNLMGEGEKAREAFLRGERRKD
jgi:enoyl-CoA hydratase